MSKIVIPQLIMNGEDFMPNHGYNVTVEQSLGGHSAFGITFLASATEDEYGTHKSGADSFSSQYRSDVGNIDTVAKFIGRIED